MNGNSQIRVAIVDDHQSIIDGYLHRLAGIPRIQVVAYGHTGEDLQNILTNQPVDVLLLDLSVPISNENHNSYPILHEMPAMLRKQPGMKVIVITMYTQLSLIKAIFNLGISGYIFKDDEHAIQQLGNVVISVAEGRNYFSEGAYPETAASEPNELLTPRQMEVISLCMAYPDLPTDILAVRLNISSSTLRNLLSSAYQRLGVQTRAAAILEVQRQGILPEINNATLPGEESLTDG
jgi:two-component system capsular synthesis response regulator RcsB